MRYFDISFHYHVSKKEIEDSWKEDPQNKGGHITSPAQSWAGCTVDAFLDAFFVGMGLLMQHSYSWPDGSCYKYAAFDGTGEALAARVNHLLRQGGDRVPYGLRVESIDEIDKDEILTNRGGVSIEELFAQ